MKLYTIGVQYWRKAKKQDIPFRDVTVKSGNKAFAPSWPLLSRYKAGLIDEAQYTERYYEEMRESYRSNREEWDLLLSYDTVAIGCYCPAGGFCHRYLLVDMIRAVAQVRGIDFEYLGEL